MDASLTAILQVLDDAELLFSCMNMLLEELQYQELALSSDPLRAGFVLLSLRCENLVGCEGTGSTWGLATRRVVRVVFLEGEREKKGDNEEVGVEDGAAMVQRWYSTMWSQVPDMQGTYHSSDIGDTGPGRHASLEGVDL